MHSIKVAFNSKGKPLFYAINCTHVSDFLPLFENKKDKPWMDRLVEVMANPSTKVMEKFIKQSRLGDDS